MSLTGCNSSMQQDSRKETCIDIDGYQLIYLEHNGFIQSCRLIYYL